MGNSLPPIIDSITDLLVTLEIVEIFAIYSSKNVPLYPKTNITFTVLIKHLYAFRDNSFSLTSSLMLMSQGLQGRSFIPPGQTENFVRLLAKTQVFNMLASSTQRFLLLQMINAPQPTVAGETIRVVTCFASPNHVLPSERDYYYSYFKLHNDDVSDLVTKSSFNHMGMPLDYVFNGLAYMVVLLLVLLIFLMTRFVVFQLQQSFETEVATEAFYLHNDSITSI
jgi:hypothetical protein